MIVQLRVFDCRGRTSWKIECCNKLCLFQALERTQIKQKMEIDDLNHHILALRKTAEKEQDSLQKACQEQKLRAQKFEAAIEKYYDELKEKVLVF